MKSENVLGFVLLLTILPLTTTKRVLFMAVQAELEPFVIVPLSTNSIDVPDEDLLDQFDDEEAEEIYHLLCYTRLSLLKKFIVPVIILFYAALSFILIIPKLEWTTTSVHYFQCCAIFLIALTLCSYFKASLSHPGRVPPEWLRWKGKLSETPLVPIYGKLNNAVKLSDNERLKQSVFCKWCQHHRPFRCAHCSACDKCVCHMDHHCEFMQNCVGCYNHRFFLQFIVYLFIIVCMYLYYVQDIMHKLDRLKTLIIISWFTALVWNLWLVYRLIIPQFHQLFINEVYIERKFQIFAHRPNDFATDSLYKNIEIVMGSSILRWFLPLEWTTHDLKLRGIDTSYKSFDLLKSTVQLRDAVDQYKQMKLNDNHTKHRL